MATAGRPRGRPIWTVFAIRLGGLVAWFAAGCAAPGEPWAPAAEADGVLLGTWPPHESREIPVGTTIDLCFSVTLDPGSLDAFDATLSSGGVVFDAATEIDLFAIHAPGSDRPANQRWCPGSVVRVRAVSELLPGIRYRVRLVEGVAGWDGAPVTFAGPGAYMFDAETAAVEIAFTTAADPDPRTRLRSTGESDRAPMTLADLFTASGPWAAGNPTCSCHRDSSDPALARLDLRDPASAWARLRPDHPDALVSPGHPWQSPLVHKLLRDPGGGAVRGIKGDPMPPDEPVPHDAAVQLVQWIADGARP